MKRNALTFVLALFFLTGTMKAEAENYTLNGGMDSALQYELKQQITAPDGVRKLEASFVIPQSFHSPTYGQEVKGCHLSLRPEPQEKQTKTDKRGNSILQATWTSSPTQIDITLTCEAKSFTRLDKIKTNAPFPLSSTPPDLADFLKPTALVQSDDQRVKKLATELTQGVTTQFDAVQRIVSWVVDNVRYVTPPPQYDALYTLESGQGNCQNYSHLSAALLRAVGIPTRIVNGVTLNKPLDVKWERGILTFKMGQGRHSWIEAWFPDLGWVPFDAQNSVLFVSNRFLRIEIGTDNAETKNDGLVRWVQVKGAKQPSLQENINAEFKTDQVVVAGKRENFGPKNLLLTPPVIAAFKPLIVPPPPPPPVITEAEKKALKYDQPFLFGNLKFPENVNFAFPRTTTKTKDNQFEMKKNFLVETAEYVTQGVTQYAQAFVLTKPVKLEKVGLALHKFGGDGILWVDLLADKNGKPGDIITASSFVDLEKLSLRPGYRWEDFEFPDRPELLPGRYWIALGFTGSPVVNWFYTYGKPVGPVDGTRYKGVFEEDWSGALGYEFNYRLIGKTVRSLSD
ncbi:MAG TPA: transglutaminase-like domain-containing protein [Syntrophales bacterium]|nr:transglutaminase-like domain-containing protein [Syntrophales bacterium]HOL59164.1 transglutaminase-like domain-containing protein [Syntrophales bacterium]